MVHKKKLITFGTVVLVVAAFVTAPVGAQSQNQEENATGSGPSEFEQNRPAERLMSISENAYISSHEWEDGDVVLTVVSRSNGYMLTVSDGLANLDPDSSGYREAFRLDEGENQIRVSGAGTFPPDGRGAEYYAIRLEGVRSGEVTYAYDRVTKPLPIPEVDSWVYIFFTGLVEGSVALSASYLFLSRRTKRGFKDL